MTRQEAPYSTLVEEAIEAWEGVRRGVLEEAEVVSEEEYDWRPAGESRSVAELLRHILESGLVAVGELARGDGDFTRQSFGEHVAEYAGALPEDMDPEALRDHLRTTFAEGAATLRARGELQMLQMIHRFDGIPGTRLAWFNHHIAHEMYHRGQLTLYVRLMGYTPALTTKIQDG